MSLDKTWSQCCPPIFCNCLWLFFYLNKRIKENLHPKLPSSHGILPASLLLPGLSNLSCFPFSKFQGRSLNEQLPQQALPMFSGQPTNRGYSCIVWLAPPWRELTSVTNSESTSFKPEIPDLTFLPNFPVGNLSCWTDSFQISI